MWCNDRGSHSRETRAHVGSHSGEHSATISMISSTTSVGRVGILLLRMGQQEEALQVCRDAIDIRKRLAENNPVAFNPDLARSLDNLGVILSEMGSKKDALQASQDAVNIQRRLIVGQNKAGFFTDLAHYLNNLSLRLSESGLREEALHASKEGVTIGNTYARSGT